MFIMRFWDTLCGKRKVGENMAHERGIVTVDDKGRVLIPADIRRKMNLRTGTKLKIKIERGNIILQPLVPEPTRVRRGREWGKEAFLDAGEATFGEY